MPKSLERLIKKRGGATKIRTKKLKGGGYIRFYIVKKAGPRGGHTIGQANTKGKRRTRTRARRGGKRG